MPINGTRTIEVDGTLYHWRVRNVGDQESLTVLVELALEPGSVLVADLGRLWIDHWLCMNDPVKPVGSCDPIRTGEVAECIRLALTKGWRPGERGGPYRLNWKSRE